VVRNTVELILGAMALFSIFSVVMFVLMLAMIAARYMGYN